MYDSTDPRSKLADKKQEKSSSESIAEPQTVQFTKQTLVLDEPGVKVWSVRGQNFLVEYVMLASHSKTALNYRRGCIIILDDDKSKVIVSHNGSTAKLESRGLIAVPPGDVTIDASEEAVLVLVSDTVDDHRARRAINADSYESPHPRVRTLRADSKTTKEMKRYLLSDYPPEVGRFGTIFRTDTLMVNFLNEQRGPRDPEKLSPHHHDDFEQGSVTLEGEWVHHIRTPWTTRQSQWREDQHTTVEGPSVTIIPPPTIHTSRAIGLGVNRMVDVFSPPREDFAELGWVVNDKDFPQ